MRESYQLGGVATSLDWVEVTDLFWNINHTYNLKYDKLDDQEGRVLEDNDSWETFEEQDPKPHFILVQPKPNAISQIYD